MVAVRWVPLARVGRPHGLRGEIRARCFNPTSRTLVDGAKVLVRPEGKDEIFLDVETVRGTDAEPILKFAGIDDRDRVGELRGAVVLVDRRDLPPAEDGEFYLVDAIGASVRTAEVNVGTVVDVASYPAADVLIVETKDREPGATIEIPVTDGFVDSVDLERNEIVLHEGAVERLSMV